jgi:hypothetical protein
VDVELMPQRTDAAAYDDGAGQSPAFGPNVPNPFQPQTALRYALPQAGHVQISVHDPEGRMITTLVDRWLASGPHVAHWDGRDAAGRQAAPGVYFAMLKTAGHEASWRMVRMR